MTRLGLAFTLAASVAAIPLPGAAQSDETCIAYMEADAAYESSLAAELVSPTVRAASRHWTEAIGILREATEKLDANKSSDEFRIAEETWFEAVAAVLEAQESIAKLEAAARAEAEPARDAAYRAAYIGPTSTVASVMEKLIAADRERCRERLE